MDKKRKILLKIPMFSRLDALIQHRNNFLLKKTEHEINMRINKYALDDAIERKEIDVVGASVLEQEVQNQKVGAEAFNRSIDVIDTMIQEELDQIKEDKKPNEA